MNADQDNIMLTQEETSGIYTPYTFCQRNVVIFRDQQFCIDTTIDEILYNKSSNFTIVEWLTELSNGTAFVGCHEIVTIVDEDL